MTFLNETDKQHLRNAIRAAEARTTGEIVTVIAGSSSDYLHYPTVWAALLAMLAPLLPIAMNFSFAPLGVIELQLLSFVLLLAVFRWPPLKMWLVPRAVKHQYCAHRAREQFLAQNLHTTKDRTGVLLYVSIAERHITLLADTGIHAKVPAGTWDKIVADFTNQLRANQISKGFIDAVNATGAQLATYFPAAAINPNELTDHLIEL
jgi:putative membrane protein